MSPLSNEWTVLEKLLLTQAVYKYGENMWFQVARVLKQHGLIQQQNLQRQPDFYSQKNCSFQYYLLIENMEAEKQVFRNDFKNDMPVVVRLAKQLYIQRVDEIKKSIQRDQDEFNQLATEIDEIKAGKWDMQFIPAEVQFSESHFKRTTEESSIDSSLGNNEQRQKAWQKNINLLWQEIANHKNGTMFMNPIKKAHAPLYDKVIVKTTAEFERDVTLMLTNSLMYNKEGTEMYLMAQEMLEDVREQIRLFKSADSYSTAFWENDV
ncbi:hypothetical protein EDC96DRAFT_437523 [Choanephora cucurbitarum]|nr:hypothetical protein EDC96DRAFT_437523 [Choanephora cucurbitarum]